MSLVADGNRSHQAACAGLFHLLARLWERELDADLARELATPPLAEAFADAAGVQRGAWIDVPLEALAAEYCRLFVGPAGHRPPLQSVWETGSLVSDAGESMAAWLDLVELGLTRSPARFPDHLGVQLEVAARLVEPSPAWRTDRTAMETLVADFLDAHLSWPGPLLQFVEEEARMSFYAGLARITRDALGEIRHTLGQPDQAGRR